MSNPRRRTLAGLSVATAFFAAGLLAFGPAAQSEPLKTKAEILKDGKVTADEQRAAVANVVGCLKDAGIAARAIPTSDDDYWTYSFTAPSTDAAAGTAQESQRCASRHLREVLDLYDSAEKSLTEADSQAAVDAMSECLHKRGIRTPELPEKVDGPAYKRLLDEARTADPAATGRCAVEAGLARSATYGHH